MYEDRLWHINTTEFATAVESTVAPVAFDLDETVDTWQASYFRFVRSPITTFPSLIDFAAMAIYTTLSPDRTILDWARSVAIFPVMPENYLDMIEGARSDCEFEGSNCKSIPDWLKFDGDLIDVFELFDRGGWLLYCAEHQIYRTTSSYYYICLSRQS